MSTRKKLLEEADIELNRIRREIHRNDKISEGFWEKIKSLRGKSFVPLDWYEKKQEREKEKLKKYSKPPFANRWGEKISDPDISWQDYEEMRRIDPTLPKYDPREYNGLKQRYALQPWRKWLYFSEDYGSYEERLKRAGSPEFLSKLYPGYWPDKLNELPKDAMEIFDNKKEYESLIAKIFWTLAGLI